MPRLHGFRSGLLSDGWPHRFDAEWIDIERKFPGASAQWAAQGFEADVDVVLESFWNAADGVTIVYRSLRDAVRVVAHRFPGRWRWECDNRWRYRP